MVKNQTILETLKELENLSHVDVQDPEDEEFERGRISSFHETLDEEVKNKFGGLRKSLGDDVDEVDKKYAGQKISKRSILEWSDDDTDDDSENTDDGDIDDDITYSNGNVVTDEEQDISGVDDEIDHDGDGDAVGYHRAASSNKLSNVDDVNDDDEDAYTVDDDVDDAGAENEDSDSNEIIDNTMNIDLNSLPNDLKDGDHNDGGVIHFTSSSTEDDNRLKGQATKSQLDILDKLLESRIRLQKSLQLCNQFPQHDIMPKFREDCGPLVKESYESVKISMKELLNKLLKLQEELCETNVKTSLVLKTGDVPSTDPGDEEIPSDTEDEEENEDVSTEKHTEKNSLNLPSKRKHTLTVAEYGEELVKRHKALQPFQESTINKWHEKTRLASSIISNKKFASFDKSVLHQIKQVLMDKSRLIKRTQLSRVPLNILGKPTNVETKTDNTGGNEEETDLHLKNYDENIFDDGDFYHEMLKELIERKSNIDADDPVAAGRRWLELQKLRSKIKRKVDTRASKGRKVRYDVHTKLVSFMAPQNVGAMSDQARNNLFSSLFGQKAMTI